MREILPESSYGCCKRRFQARHTFYIPAKGMTRPSRPAHGGPAAWVQRRPGTDSRVAGARGQPRDLLFFESQHHSRSHSFMHATPGNVFMVVAPSGAGKSSLVKALLAQDSSILLSISCTTRAPRPGEEDGREYRFVSIDD